MITLGASRVGTVLHRNQMPWCVYLWIYRRWEMQNTEAWRKVTSMGESSSKLRRFSALGLRAVYSAEHCLTKLKRYSVTRSVRRGIFQRKRLSKLQIAPAVHFLTQLSPSNVPPRKKVPTVTTILTIWRMSGRVRSKYRAVLCRLQRVCSVLQENHQRTNVWKRWQEQHRAFTESKQWNSVCWRCTLSVNQCVYHCWNLVQEWNARKLDTLK